MGILKYFEKKANNFYVSLLNPNFSTLMGGTSTVASSDLIENFETIPDLFIINNFLAKRVAKIPVKVVKPSGKDSNNSDLWNLIKKPNYYQSWRELMKLNYSYYNLLGNNYTYGLKSEGYKGGQITQIYNLPADKTEIILLADKDNPNWLNEIVGYVVTIGGTKYTLEKAEVLHSKYINLRYDSGAWAYGISKYIPGDKVNKELKAIYDAKTSIIENRGALGIVSNKSEIPDEEESIKVKERLKQKFGLGSDQDKFIVTTQNLSWQQMSLNVQELQLIENAKYSFEKLCQLSEFDPVIFSTEGSTFANKQEAIKDLYKNVIKGDVDEIYEGLSQWLSPFYNGDRIVPDWDKVQELENDKKVYTDMLTKQIEYSIITPLKASEILYGENNYDAGNPPPDEYFHKGLKKINEPEPEPKEPEEIIDPELVKELAKEPIKTNGNGQS